MCGYTVSCLFQLVCRVELAVKTLQAVRHMCRSSEWGVKPWHWYATSALPRGLLIGYPLAFLGCLLERRVRVLAGVIAVYIAMYSFLPHKEVRLCISQSPAFELLIHLPEYLKPCLEQLDLRQPIDLLP